MASWFEGLSTLKNWNTANKTLWLVSFGTSDNGMGSKVRIWRAPTAAKPIVVFRLAEAGTELEMSLRGAEFERLDEAPFPGDFGETFVPPFLQIVLPDGNVSVVVECLD